MKYAWFWPCCVAAAFCVYTLRSVGTVKFLGVATRELKSMKVQVEGKNVTRFFIISSEEGTEEGGVHAVGSLAVTADSNSTGMISETLETPNEAFETALGDFVQALHDQPEKLALSKWSSPPPSVREFPALSSQLIQEAFGNKRIALVGDSTSYYILRWMETLMLKYTTKQQDAILQNSSGLKAANWRTNPKGDRNVGWPDDSPSVLDGQTALDATHLNKTHIVWDGRRGGFSNSCSYNDVWARMRKLKPQVLVVNVGLHWLHFEKAGRDASLCYLNRFIHYEQWLEEVLARAEEVGAKLLLFKTTNFVCTDMYTGYFKKGADVYAKAREQLLHTSDTPTSNQSSILNTCLQSYRAKLVKEQKKHYNITTLQIQRYCRDGTFDERGASHLNGRLLDFVESKRQSTTGKVRMAVFNDHDLQSCRYTTKQDGRHYHSLNIIRIRLLAIMIQALYPEKG